MDLSDFEKNKSEFFKQIKAAIKEDESILLAKKSKGIDVSHAVYNLIQNGIKGKIKRDSLLTAIEDLTYLHKDIASIIMDVFHVLDTETQTQSGFTAEERATFGSILKSSEKIFSEKLLKERLEIDTLQEFGIVNKTFYTKFIKVKTKLYYKQRRFNLFREENEGYAKLLTELNKDFSEDGGIADSLQTVKSLIGCFNVDPNRVLDVILESFEARPERHELFIPLLQSYMPDSNIISEVLGYKYRNFQDEPAPLSLHRVTAILMQYDIIKIDDIYPWLTPVDEQMASDWESEISEAKEFVRRLNIVSINKDKVEDDKIPDIDTADDKYAINQKLGLCEAMLMIGDWTNAKLMIEKLPEKCATSHEQIAKSICKLMHQIIEPLYRIHCEKFSNIKNAVMTISLSEKAPPQVINFVNLKDHVFPMCLALGPSLHHDPILLQKLIRLIRKIIEKSEENEENGTGLYHEIISLIDICILPSLSYLDCNCIVAEEIWSVVKIFPYNVRYALYSRWKNESYLSHPKLIRKRGLAHKEIKDIMKKVCKENIKPVGRRIGKLTHSSPGFLFDYVIGQIQLYDNLIGPVVDALRFLTSLSYDVLGYCVIEALVNSDRDRFKYGGTTISDWLQSLANFCGSIYKKYSIELSGLLQYICNQLKAHKSLDLLILKEIVHKMSGIEAAEEMTKDQLAAMCGGELLKGEAGYFSQVRNTKKSSQRLKDALANNDLAVALCLLTAQQKHSVVYRETQKSHLKLVGMLYDQCQNTLVQFGNFLGSTYSVEEYSDRLPSIQSMLQEFHMHSDVAFFLARPMLGHAINQKYDQLKKSDTSSKKITQPQRQEFYLEAANIVMQPVIASVQPLHHLKVWEDISPKFFVTFWSMTINDLQIPQESYQKEIDKIRIQINQLSTNESSSSSKIKKEHERFHNLIERLQDEKKKQQEHVDRIIFRLNSEKDSWFPTRAGRTAKNETIPQFLQLCLFPRCTFTALDAMYCAEFIHTIHKLRTPNFSTLLCYDRILCDITCCVTSCTENEASRFGLFLDAMLENVMKWHANIVTFNKECFKYPGFVTKFRVSNQCSDTNDHVGYENFRHVCYKWHLKMTKAIVTLLSSKDYVQIRNAFIILKYIQNHFPVVNKTSQVIQKRVERVRDEEKDKRPDLQTLAASYLGILKQKREHLIEESEFHQVSGAANKQAEQSVNGDKSIKKIAKDRERSEKRNTSVTVEREIKKETPVREPSTREPTPREKSVKHSARDEKREREESPKKRDKDKEKRRDKRATSPPTDTFEGDLSSVSNSSNGSMLPTADVVIVDDHREPKRRKIEAPSKKRSNEDDEIIEVKKEKTSKKEKRVKETDEEKELRKREKLIKKRQEREEIQPVVVEKRRKDEDRSVKMSHHNGEEDDRLKRHIRVNNEEVYNRDDRHEREKGHSQRRTGRNAH